MKNNNKEKETIIEKKKTEAKKKTLSKESVSAKKKPKIEIVKTDLTLEEKIIEAMNFLDFEDRISNFVKIRYQEKKKKPVNEWYEFWYDKGKRMVEKFSYPKPSNPRTSCTIFTLQRFQDESDFPNIRVVYQNLLEKNKEYIYHINPIIFHLISLGSIASYFPEVFESFPYYDFYGSDPECGKSTSLKCLTYASFHGDFVVDPSKAAIYRTLDIHNCMMGFDELGKLLSTEAGRYLYPILLNGDSQDGVVSRCNEDRYTDIDYFRVFGLKGWTRLEWLKPELLSRAITFTMVRNDGRKELRIKPKPIHYSSIRNDLYLIRLINHDEVEKIYHELLLTTELLDRTRDKFLPLLTIAKIVDNTVYYEVLEFAKDHHKKRSIAEMNTWNILLMETLYEKRLFGEQKVLDIRNEFRLSLVSAGEILDDTKSINKIKSRMVLLKLTGFGFQRTSKRTDGNVHINIDWKTFEQQAHIYLKGKVLVKPEAKKRELNPLEKEILKASTKKEDNEDNEVRKTDRKKEEKVMIKNGDG